MDGGDFIFDVYLGYFNMFIQKQQEAEREAIIKNKKEFMMKRQQGDVRRMLERQVHSYITTQSIITSSYQLFIGFTALFKLGGNIG